MSKLFMQKGFLSGLLFLLIGVGVVVVGRDYRMGTVQNMGPGYVPLSLGSILVLLGLSSCIISARNAGTEETLAPIPWRALGMVILSIVVFGLLIERAGLLAAVASTVIIATLANKSAKIFPSLISLLLLLVLTGLLFVFGLEQPFYFLLPHS